MFPLNWNIPFIKKTGERTTLGAVIGSGGGSDLPPYSVADSGKVLAVNSQGALEWTTITSANRYAASSITVPTPEITTNTAGGT